MISLLGYHRGQTSVILRFKLFDSSVTTQAGKTGLTNASSGLIISTIADNEASATTYTSGGSTIDTIATLGTYATPTSGHCNFKEVDSTNHKGIYELQLEDARFAVTDAKTLLVSISGVTNLAQQDILIPLMDMDPYDAVRGGMSALPNAAAGASSGLLVNGTNTGTIQVDALTIAGALTIDHVTVTPASGVSGMTISGGTGNQNAIQLLGNGSAAGLASFGGSSNGSGIALSPGGSGFALNLAGAGGFLCQGEFVVQNGMFISATTSGFDGLKITGNGTGSGVKLLGGTNGPGLTLTAGGTNDDLHLSAPKSNIPVNVTQLNGGTTALVNLIAMYGALETGTAQAGGTNTITLRAGASSVTDSLKDQVIVLLTGTGAGQTNRISAYNGSTKVASVETNWVTTPDATTTYVVLGRVG